VYGINSVAQQFGTLMLRQSVRSGDMRVLLQLLLLAGLLPFSWCVVEVVSIVDQKSATSCLVKVFSILESATDKQLLSFRFLVFETATFSSEGWSNAVKDIFAGIVAESTPWAKPLRFPGLSGKGFDQEMVFARFYLGSLWAGVPKFIFLDNDVVVTCDLYQLYYQRLYTSEDIPGSDVVTTPRQQINPRTIGRAAHRPGGPTDHSRALGARARQSAAVGFVYERHPGYKDYLRAHFNTSDSLVSAAIAARAPDVFMNAGVFVMDTRRWEESKATQRMEALMRLNRERYIFNAEAVGDQGPFLLLYVNETAYLSPQYNMRRQPKKTINMLSSGTTGIAMIGALLVY
jgi:lipopolysaccharide biosynthesis glycosyltransferase